MTESSQGAAELQEIRDALWCTDGYWRHDRLPPWLLTRPSRRRLLPQLQLDLLEQHSLSLWTSHCPGRVCGCSVPPSPPPLLTLPRTLPAPHVLPPPLAAAQHAGPELPVPLAAAQHAGPELPVALKTQYQRKLNTKRRAEAQPGRTYSSRAGVQQVQKCRKCGQPRRKETGHSRHGREFFCSVAAGKSVEDWLREKKERDQGGAPD
ncbi:unnamed protein product [Arctogadus glacialis]